MKLSGAQIVMKAFREEGLGVGLGIPGTHNIELYDEMRDPDGFTPLLVTDEQCASFMADGYARSSGKMAVLNVVPGAGLTHALSGIAEAYMDNVPMLVLGCGIRRDKDFAFQLHDIDQLAVARPVCKKVYSPQTHAELYQNLRDAIHLARSAPAGPVFVEVPVNLYLFPSDFSDTDFSYTSTATSQPLAADTIATLIPDLNKSQSIGIYAGLGCADATEELLELAEKLDAIVFSTISGKGVFPEDHPRFVWNTMGNALPDDLKKFDRGLDCLIAVGCRFGEVATASYGFTPPEMLIHIDADKTVFNRNFKAAHTLEANAKTALRALLNSVDLKTRMTSSDLDSLHQAKTKIRQTQLKDSDPQKVSPAKLAKSLQDTFGEKTIFVADSGNGTFLAMENLNLRHPRCFLAPVDYSCMGYSVPAAIGAKLANPETPVVGLIGDGAFLMTGMEMLTAKNYGLGVVFCILNDGELSQISQFQNRLLNRKTLTTLFPFNYRHFAQAIGLDYVYMGQNSVISDCLSEAKRFAAKGKPVLVEVNIDYSQATYFSQGVVKTNFHRYPLKDRFRLVGRVLKRKIMG